MTKAVAIMQPYIFPYLGYFCLIEACDTFVFYDDVNYIKQGWINRNRILVNRAPFTFTVPLRNGSSFELINNVATSNFDKFRNKFIKQIEQSYSHAPYYLDGLKYVKTVLAGDNVHVSQLAIKSITELYRMLNIQKKFMLSSESFAASKGIDRSDRLIYITKEIGCSHYINSIGGANIYNKIYFAERGIKLSFVKPNLLEYRQTGAKDFSVGLSIIDVVMNNNMDQIKLHLASYELI